MKFNQILLLALIGLIMFATISVRAEDADVEDVPAEDIPDEDHGENDDTDYNPDEQERDPNAISGIFARATFGSDLMAPAFPAGEKITTQVAFANAAENTPYTVAFVVAHITHVADTNYYIQNFTATRHARAVAGGETHSFKYEFTPDANLEPNDYGLVVRMYFLNDANNTYVTVAYNDTITVTEPLGADPKTFMTFATIAAIVGGIAYAVTSRKKKVFKPSGKKGGAVEMGTKAAIDPDYIDKSHIRYEEARKSASPKRSNSNKK